MTTDLLTIAGKQFSSRLFLGTGKYASPEETVAALDASGTQLVTVAIRRLDLDTPNKLTELDYIDWQRYTVLPNTAGCRTVEEALMTARLGRSVTGSTWVKLEVIPDPKYLMPDPIGTLRAAEQLLSEGFVVLPYIHADPMLARHLEELGCATVMPLGSAIGSGQGILTIDEIKIIIENAGVPVVVDAGLGAPPCPPQAGARRPASPYRSRRGHPRSARRPPAAAHAPLAQPLPHADHRSRSTSCPPCRGGRLPGRRRRRQRRPAARERSAHRRPVRHGHDAPPRLARPRALPGQRPRRCGAGGRRRRRPLARAQPAGQGGPPDRGRGLHRRPLRPQRRGRRPRGGRRRRLPGRDRKSGVEGKRVD